MVYSPATGPPRVEYPVRPAKRLAEPTDARSKRGLGLFRQRASEIRQLGPGNFWVPSGDRRASGRGYFASIVAGKESCTCPDFIRHARNRDPHTSTPSSDDPQEASMRYRTCKHLYAALIWQAKSRECAGCRVRVLGRYLYEVLEEHLTYFAGDELCAGCASEGGLL